jgi:DNA modification methylase
LANKPVQLAFWDEKGPEKLQTGETPETYKGIYAMHKYWSKKPHNLIAGYIERFSAPGDIVLDSFCGSGVTLIESVRLGRRAIGIDINPIAVLIAEMGLSHTDVRKLKKQFGVLRNVVKPLIDKMYLTECQKCQSAKAIVTHTIWKGGFPKEVWYECSQCQTRKDIRSGSDKDLRAGVQPEVAPRWYPTTELIPNARINAKAGMRVSDLFTKRALVGLSLLLDEIRRVEDDNIRSVLEFCFTGALAQASNLVFVIRRRGKTAGKDSNNKAEVGSWVIGYWVPQEHFEINVWRCFANRFRRVLKGKSEVNCAIPKSVAHHSTFESLDQAEEGYWLGVGTASNLPIPPQSVDYALIDPPHGNRIPYLELSLMWNSWLGLRSDWQNEIIISEARTRDKNVDDYHNGMLSAFNELWRVLKPGSYASVIFNSLDDETWLSLLNACLGAGFQITEIDPLAYSAQSVVQDTRKQALKTDFVITCQKTVPREPRLLEFSDDVLELERHITNYLSQLLPAESR